MRRLLLASLTSSLLLACGGGSDNPDAAGNPDAASNNPDAAETPDAPGVPDAALPIDAAPAALGCLGDPLPTTADDPLIMAGTVFEPELPSGQTPIAGAEVHAYMLGDETTPLDTDTSATTTGAFSLSVATGASPINGYLRGRRTGYMTTYVYPPTAMSASQNNVAVALTPPGNFQLLEFLLGVTQANDSGFVTILVVDCAGDPIAGASVTSTPAAGTTAYMDGSTPSTTVTATDSSGLAFLFNVPAGSADLDATVDGMQLRTNTITVPTHVAASEADRIVTTVIVP